MREPYLAGRELLERWIQPAPRNKREWTNLESEWRAAIQSIRSMIECIPSAPEVKPALDEVIKRSEALREAIEALPYGARIKLPAPLEGNRPRIVASCPGAGTRIVDELAYLEAQIHLWREAWEAAPNTRPVRYDKRACLLCCHRFLEYAHKARGINKDGPVAALAQSAWHEITHEWTELNSWERHAERIRKDNLSRGYSDPFH